MFGRTADWNEVVWSQNAYKEIVWPVRVCPGTDVTYSLGEIRILIMGSCFHGKSATANTILGRQRFTLSDASSSKLCQLSELGVETYKDARLKVDRYLPSTHFLVILSPSSLFPCLYAHMEKKRNTSKFHTPHCAVWNIFLMTNALMNVLGYEIFLLVVLLIFTYFENYSRIQAVRDIFLHCK